MALLSNNTNEFCVAMFSILFIFLCPFAPLSVWFYRFKGFPLGRIISVVYMIWIWSNRKIKYGPRHSWVRKNWFIGKLRAYFSASIKYDFDVSSLDMTKTYVIALQPHGYIGLCNVLNFACWSGVFPGLDWRLAGLEVNFYSCWAPLYRALGCTGSGIEVLTELLRKNISCAIAVGGARESIYTGFKARTFKRRTGFIRLAIEEGADIIPVYNRGTDKMFHRILPNPEGSLVYRLQTAFLDMFTFTLPFINPLPIRSRLTSFIGEPIGVLQTKNPTKEMIKDISDIYVSRMTALCRKYEPGVEICWL